jgi:hypothetical protein
MSKEGDSNSGAEGGVYDLHNSISYDKEGVREGDRIKEYL